MTPGGNHHRSNAHEVARAQISNHVPMQYRVSVYSSVYVEVILMTTAHIHEAMKDLTQSPVPSL